MIWLFAGAFAADLFDARVVASHQPTDYAAQVDWARAAAAAGYGEEALEAWTAAAWISGPNLETDAGKAVALRLAGRHAEALAAAAALTRDWPDAADAWSIRADTQAWSAPAVAFPVGAAWAERAARLDASPDRRCVAAGWSFDLGDRPRARRWAGDLRCPAIDGALRSPIGAWGGAFVAGLGRTGATTVDGGVAGGAQAGIVVDGGFHAEVTGREVALHTEDDTWSNQTEAWLRLGYQRRGFGGQALGGVLIPGGATVFTNPGWVVGGRAFARFGVGIAVDGVFARWSDADQVQVGVVVDAPVTAAVGVSAGVQFTQLTPTDTAAETGWSGRLGASWRRGGYDASALVRFGTELRPIRFDDPSAYNLLAPLGPVSASIGVGIPLIDGFTLRPSYVFATSQGSDGAVDGTVHTGTLGFWYTNFGGSR